MISVVPEGWSVYALGDICRVKGGKRLPKGSAFSETITPFPYIRVADFESGSIETRGIKYVSTNVREQIKRYTISSSDIYISIAGSIGLVGIVPRVFNGALLTENAAKIVLNDEYLDRTYLCLFLSSEIAQSQFKQEIGTGGGVPKLALFRIEQTVLSVPPLPEQKKIASILTSVDEVIENTSRQIDKLQDLKKATMNELLTKGIGHTEFKDSELGQIPESWEVKSLEHVCEKIWIGLVTTMTKFYVEKGIPLIRNSDIKETGIRMPKLIQLDIDFSKKHSSRAVQKGDVVTVHTGDIGTSAVINHLLDGAQGFATLNSRINKSLIIPQFYSQILNSEDFKLRAKRVVTGDGRDNLNLKDFVGLLISVPQSLSEQENIVTTLLSLEQNIDRLTHKLSQTQSLKKSLMQDLLTGKVRVTVN